MSSSGRHLASSSAGSSSFMSAELPSNDSFVFDGTNSDLAQQLYYRALAGDTAEQLKLTQVPSSVQGRLADLQLDWDSLDGIAQGALLWDSGFGFSTSNVPVQMFTDGTHSMADLAIPIDDFMGAGCTWMNCTQPDGTISYSNYECNGDQMVSATRCLMEDFDAEALYSGAMWSTGGSSTMIPLPHVVKNVWTDVMANHSYVVLAIHTMPPNQEPGFGICPDGSTNGGYGSLVVACASTTNLSAMPGAKMTIVEGSPWKYHGFSPPRRKNRSGLCCQFFSSLQDTVRLRVCIAIIATLLCLGVQVSSDTLRCVGTRSAS